MIYSKFGTPLKLLSKSEDAPGRLIVQATTDGESDVREYAITDLKADNGPTELAQAIEALPTKVAPQGPGRRIYIDPQANRLGQPSRRPPR